MNLPSKEHVCRCGHRLTITRKADYCNKCGNKIFYDPAENRRHRLNGYYMSAIVLIVVTFLTYLYIELIASPLLKQ